MEIWKEPFQESLEDRLTEKEADTPLTRTREYNNGRANTRSAEDFKAKC